MSNYSTVAEVRQETGLLGDPTVKDMLIQTYMDQATGIVLSGVSAVYDSSNLKPGTISSDSQAYGFLKRAETLFASGYLLIKLYGGDIDGDKDGYEKISEAKSLLLMLTNSKTPMRLIDENGSEYARISGTGVNAGKLAASDTVKNSTPIFKVTDEY